MNWGKWIIIAFVLFACFIATLVTVCVKQDISLVSKDYYKEELIYQAQIDRMNNVQKLDQKPVIKVLSNNVLEVNFRSSVTIEKGELTLFCPSNPKMDRKFNLENNTDAQRLLPINSLQKGMYRAQLLWTMKGKEFYLEEVIYI